MYVCIMCEYSLKSVSICIQNTSLSKLVIMLSRMYSNLEVINDVKWNELGKKEKIKLIPICMPPILSSAC